MENEESFVRLVNVNKIYEDGYHAVHDFNIDIKRKEFIVFVGPSGCGKSTTIRMIAGLEDIASGELYIDGVLSNATLSKDRDIAMVFQNYALYPNLTVYNNMAFSLQLRRCPKEEIDQRVKEAAKILELTDYLQRKPKNLSGGQRQRVALGRAIVRNARIFLMDEPLSNLDAKLRVQMRSEIIKIHKAVGATTIYVTHDQTEAMTMADRIVVMKDGFIQQIGKPREIYKEPVNKFVATFIGSPAMNFIPVTYKHNNEVFFLDGDKFVLKDCFEKKFKEHFEAILDENNALLEEMINKDIPPVKGHFFKKKKIEAAEKEKQDEIDAQKAKIETIQKVVSGEETSLTFGIRPESIVVSRKEVEGAYKVTVTLSELLGDEYYAHFDFQGKSMLVKISSEEDLEAGDPLYITLKEKNIYLFDDFSDKRIFY